MCNDAVSNNPAVLFLVPDHLKTERMCKKAVEDLKAVPDHLKTRTMCERVAERAS